jgi:hypothetical protein
MSIFNTILEKLGLRKTQSAPAAAARPKAMEKGGSSSGTYYEPGQTAVKEAPPKAISEVDVVKKLEQLSVGSGLNWKVSIVDLLTLLKIDSSREARKELAIELGCPPEMMSDSARMNVWLHKTVLKKIAENGGNIPQSLLD